MLISTRLALQYISRLLKKTVHLFIYGKKGCIVLSIIVIFHLPFLSITLQFFSLPHVIYLFSSILSRSYEPLMLKRPDPRRSTTQTWHFCSGMLTCGLLRLVVQVCLFFFLVNGSTICTQVPWFLYEYCIFAGERRSLRSV